MNHKVGALLGKIQELETEVEQQIEGQRRRFRYSIEERRIRFEEAVLRRHRTLKVGLSRFIRQSGLLRIFVSPLIYIQIIPLLLLDIAVSLFQFIIFPVYDIEKVPRDDFIVVDRQHLAYLNLIEKLNCAFCGYANGLLAYCREIAGRAEAHFCPIKHARKAAGQHKRYFEFREYGDAEGYREIRPE